MPSTKPSPTLSQSLSVSCSLTQVTDPTIGDEATARYVNEGGNKQPVLRLGSPGP
jgi:hypothetical protein